MRGFVFSSLLAIALPSGLHANDYNKERSMNNIAKGTFDVKLQPLDVHYQSDGKHGRMSIDKTFHGELEATGKGEMLTAMTDVKGSAVYVAIERVTGTLNGKKGSFTLHHRGIMNDGEQQLSVNVVPDSGTGELTGLVGEMQIQIDDGLHFYHFEYDLPE